MVQAAARGQELQLGLLRGSNLCHFPRGIGRRLDLKWSSQDLSWHSDVEAGITNGAQRQPGPGNSHWLPYAVNVGMCAAV